MKFSYLLLFVLLFHTNYVTAQDSPQKETPISVGEVINDSLLTGSIHTYTIELDSAQFVFGKANQQSVDVVVTIYDLEEKSIGSFDGPARGNESFQFDTETAGEYRIEVKPFEEEEGEYEITVSTVEPVAEEPAERVDQLMMEYAGNDVPGGGVMVMKGGEIIMEEYYGMSNLAYDIPFGSNTRNNIGSTSKQFTAFAILLLADQGELSLDDDIREYIPELPQFEDTVTIRHLLTHTSGYREFLNLIAMTGKNISSPLKEEELIRVVQRQPELQNKPGAEYNYNNTGFSLMPIVVERVTGTPFPDWMKQNLFEPLGMNNTMVRKNQFQIVPNASEGYQSDEDDGFKESTDLHGGMGASAIHTTLSDLAKWINNLNEPKVGSEEIIKEMTTSYQLNDSSYTNYGMGISLPKYKGQKTMQHGGADVAHRSMLIYFPEINSAVVTQSNYASFRGNIAGKVADVFFEEHFEKDEEEGEIAKTDSVETDHYKYDPAEFEELTGRYELAAVPGFILTFSLDADRIYTQATGQPEVDITATSDSTFSLNGVDAQLTFHLNPDGTADSLTLHQNGNHLARKINWEPGIDELEEYTGHYFSEELQTNYIVAIEDSNLVIQHYMMDDRKLVPGDIDAFTGRFPISSVEFERNEAGAVTGFKASNGRTRGVRSKKLDD